MQTLTNTDIRHEGRPYHTQADAEEFAVNFIKIHGMVSQSNLEAAYEDWLSEVDTIHEADQEMVCSESKERMYKCLENLSNHGVYEIDHDIVTINIREANRLGYKTPGGLKFREKYFARRDMADRMGLPVHDTTQWDKNYTRRTED
jgi:hypothetical protein